MSATEFVFAALSMILVSTSGIAGAVAHPQLVRVDVSGHQAVVRAADNIHINRAVNPENVAGEKQRRACCKGDRRLPPD